MSCILLFLMVYPLTIKDAGIAHNVTNTNSESISVNDVSFQDSLNMQILLKQSKRRCLFHDSFARTLATEFNGANTHVSPASSNSLGNNDYVAFENGRTKYCIIETPNRTMSVGVKCIANDGNHDTFVACNTIVKGAKQTVIESVDINNLNYRIVFKKGARNSVAKIAFRVKDINNYYYARLTNERLFIYEVKDGHEKRLADYNSHRSYCAELNICDNALYFSVPQYNTAHVVLSDSAITGKCGLLFTSNEVTEVESWFIDVEEKYRSHPFDDIIESSSKLDIKRKEYYLDAEQATVSLSNKSSSGRHGVKFELQYEKDYAKHLVSNSRRSEIILFAKESPLDSWIASFDVLFPGKNDPDYYSTDKYHENFFQSHDRNAGYGLSPQFVLRISNDNVICNIRTREELRWDSEDVIDREFIIAKLVDEKTGSMNQMEIVKGEWHNFTVYIKEGYLPEHSPRTIVYIDKMKVLDESIPNVYNAGSFASYIKMGIYKPAWKTGNLSSPTKKRVIYMDNIQYYR